MPTTIECRIPFWKIQGHGIYYDNMPYTEDGWYNIICTATDNKGNLVFPGNHFIRKRDVVKKQIYYLRDGHQAYAVPFSECLTELPEDPSCA